MSFDIGNLLQSYLTQAGASAQGSPDTQDHFHQVSQTASPDLIGMGLSALFKSDQTPPFAQSVSQMFGQSNGAQQANMLNQLIGSMGPTVLGSLLSGSGGAGLASILSQLTQGGAAPASITPEQARELSPEHVEMIANHAEQHDAGIMDVMGRFYAEHPALVKTLGSAAMAFVLARMADKQTA